MSAISGFFVPPTEQDRRLLAEAGAGHGLDAPGQQRLGDRRDQAHHPQGGAGQRSHPVEQLGLLAGELGVAQHAALVQLGELVDLLGDRLPRAAWWHRRWPAAASWLAWPMRSNLRFSFASICV